MYQILSKDFVFIHLIFKLKKKNLKNEKTKKLKAVHARTGTQVPQLIATTLNTTQSTVSSHIFNYLFDVSELKHTH